MGRAFSSQPAFADGRGADVWVEYQDNNLRVRTLNWSVSSGVWVRARIWDNGSLVFDQDIAGPSESSTNVAGNYTMREVIVDGETWLDFPAGIEYAIQVANHAWR